MQYYNLNNPSEKINFREAVIRGQAMDKGLYFPLQINKLEKSFFNSIENISDNEIAFNVMQFYAGEEIDKASLQTIIDEAFNFEIPLKKITDNISILELFHGPTYAFKDVGARFMSRCLRYLIKNNTKKTVVLVATSGDTGGAVADGFYDIEGIEVVILYPKNKVSFLQEKQLTTLGKNIHSIEIEGSFDDCQQIVKQAFTDKDLHKKFLLTSANSINVARWLPQQVYYFLAWKQWKVKNILPVISVPSGNFGNICAGLLAYQSGLPVKHFIAACNVNDTITNYFATEKYSPKPSVQTLSNAMDVGNPSNFVRILELFNKQLSNLKNICSVQNINDEATQHTIAKVFNESNYILDPHSAVGYLALENYLSKNKNYKGFFVSTASPLKFSETVEPLIQKKLSYSEEVKKLLTKEKKSTLLKADYESCKEFVMGLQNFKVENINV